MFSQFKNVMESLAQPQPQRSNSRSSSQDLSPERPDSGQRSSSFDLQSAGHLAESALFNLRKSLASQRPFAIVPPEHRPSPPPDRELKSVSKSTLDDRLRATFSIGEASTSTTPDARSYNPSPRPAYAPSRVRSPTSIPLPESPLKSPRIEHDIPAPIPLSLPPSVIARDPLGDVEIPERLQSKPNPAVEESTEPESSNENSIPDCIPEADIPLPPFSPEPIETTTSATTVMNTEDISNTELHTPNSMEVLKNDDEETVLTESPNSAISGELSKLRAAQDTLTSILLEFTSIQDASDLDGLKEYLRNSKQQHDHSQEEIRRLNGRLRTYDDRIEELRDTHKLESRSQLDLVDSLRKQLTESDALLKAAHEATARAEEESGKRETELNKLQSEAQKWKDSAKEEEEKRVKAISLLKTVRQKLVKAEKERDDHSKEINSLKEKDKSERERDRLERSRLEKEIESVRAEKEKDIAGLKTHFDRELVGSRERLEKDFISRRTQIEQEAANTKAALQKEIAQKNTKIQTLESSVRSLSSERDSLFDQIQMRQAEMESLHTHVESLQSQNSELQFQLKEATDRIALLTEESEELRREHEYRMLQSRDSEEASQKLRSLEARYEARIAQLSEQLLVVEKERDDTESQLSLVIEQKSQEVKSLKAIIDDSATSSGETKSEIEELRSEIEAMGHQILSYRNQLLELEEQKERVSELEALLQRRSDEFNAQLELFEREARQSKEREAQVRTTNKALREELRKVQASAALLERQRNPGVGYWGSLTKQANVSEARLSSPSTSDVASSSRTASPGPSRSDEEINLEYLRNVILQFLEHKEMRPHLVRVLSIILHFTPQETRRLVAKV